jgi:hypothetical protein
MLLIAGCGHIIWVDVDASGCSKATVTEMNKDSKLVDRMSAMCAMNGTPGVADELRCHDHTLQVACRT